MWVVGGSIGCDWRVDWMRLEGDWMRLEGRLEACVRLKCGGVRTIARQKLELFFENAMDS